METVVLSKTTIGKRCSLELVKMVRNVAMPLCNNEIQPNVFVNFRLQLGAWRERYPEIDKLGGGLIYDLQNTLMLTIERCATRQLRKSMWRDPALCRYPDRWLQVITGYALRNDDDKVTEPITGIREMGCLTLLTISDTTSRESRPATCWEAVDFQGTHSTDKADEECWRHTKIVENYDFSHINKNHEK